MKLILLFEQHYRIHRIVSANYEASIRNAIRKFETFLRLRTDAAPDHVAEIADFSDENLNGLCAWLIGERLARPTANKILRTLCALARFARRRGLSSYRPEVERLIERAPRPVSWRPEELAKIVAGVREFYGESYWGRTLLALINIYYETALRMIDALRLESTEPDLAAGRVFVTEKKTGKRRPFKVSDKTVAAIRRLGGTMQNLIPYRFKETNPARKRYRKVLKAAGLPSGRKDLFQKIRVSTASLAHREGLDATAILGHSAKWVTTRYYLDPDLTAPIDIANQLPPLS